MAIVAAGAFASFVRPEVQEVHRSEGRFSDAYDTWVARLQAEAGTEVDGTRRYGELSMRWLGWYLGPPTLAAGVVGLAALARRSRLPGGLHHVPFVAVFLVGAGAYLWEPSIAPDHLWAMRRFVPLALPGLVVAAFVFVQGAWDRPRRRLGWVAKGLGLAVATAGLVFAVQGLWPLRSARADAPRLAALERLCDTVGPRSAVVVLGSGEFGRSLTQSVRAFCGVPAAASWPGAGLPFFERLSAEWRAQGYRLYLVHDQARPFGPHTATATRRIFRAEIAEPEITLLRRPRRLETRVAALFVTEV